MLVEVYLFFLTIFFDMVLQLEQSAAASRLLMKSDVRILDYQFLTLCCPMKGRKMKTTYTLASVAMNNNK